MKLCFILLIAFNISHAFSAVSNGEKIKASTINSLIDKVNSIDEISGSPGAPGIQGVQGPAGAIGPQGERGIQGISGTPGSVGPKGDTGAAGSQGAQGPAGANADTTPIYNAINSKVSIGNIKRIAYVNHCFSVGALGSGGVRDLGWYNLDKGYAVPPVVTLSSSTGCSGCVETAPIVAAVSGTQFKVFARNSTNGTVTPASYCWEFAIYEKN